MNSIKSLFIHLWALLTGLAQDDLQYVETTVLPRLKTAAGALIKQLAPLALQAVIAAEVPGVAGKEKFANALETLKAAAVAAGIAAGQQLLNQSIEDAVGVMQAHIAASGVAPAPVAGNPAA